jgi:hypothetical protein
MLEIVFTVCSLVQGASCRELNAIPLQESASVLNCMFATQLEGAKWIESHPNFYIQRATCQPANRFAKS